MIFFVVLDLWIKQHFSFPAIYLSKKNSVIKELTPKNQELDQGRIIKGDVNSHEVLWFKSLIKKKKVLQRFRFLIQDFMLIR